MALLGNGNANGAHSNDSTAPAPRLDSSTAGDTTAAFALIAETLDALSREARIRVLRAHLMLLGERS